MLFLFWLMIILDFNVRDYSHSRTRSCSLSRSPWWAYFAMRRAQLVSWSKSWRMARSGAVESGANHVRYSAVDTPPHEPPHEQTRNFASPEQSQILDSRAGAGCWRVGQKYAHPTMTSLRLLPPRHQLWASATTTSIDRCLSKSKKWRRVQEDSRRKGVKKKNRKRIDYAKQATKQNGNDATTTTTVK